MELIVQDVLQEYNVAGTSSKQWANLYDTNSFYNSLCKTETIQIMIGIKVVTETKHQA